MITKAGSCWCIRIGIISACLSAILGILAVPSRTTQADEHQVMKAQVLERGIYRAVSDTRTVSHSNLGRVAKVRDALLIQSTTTVFAQQFVRFGLRFIITGKPAGAQVQIRLVTRFPEDGLQDPSSGIQHYQSEYTTQAVIGTPSYREFRFDHRWEIVPGAWVFEFWYGDRMLGAQTFCVVSEARKEADSSLECAPALTG